jgi:uncharacterized protein YjbI with pentapeptide repeats
VDFNGANLSNADLTNMDFYDDAHPKGTFNSANLQNATLTK